MESVETRKLGKHLFIFEKEKAKNPNGKAKGRTLITCCETDADNKLPPEFVKYMRTLFDILDTNKTGFVKLRDIEACWGQRNGVNGYSTLQVRGVLEHLRRVAPANGLLSFERLCMGFGQALHSSEGGSIANGSVGGTNRYENHKSSGSKLNGQNSELKPKTESTSIIGQMNPVSTVPVGKQRQTLSFPFVSRKVGELKKTNGIRENVRFGPDMRPNTESGFSHERERPKSMGPWIGEPKQTPNLFFSDKNFNGSSKIGLERDSESYKNETLARHDLRERSRPISMGPLVETHEETINVPFPPKSLYESSKTGQKSDSGLYKTDTVFIHKPERQKRPKSVLPFSEPKQPDLSVAKKKGGILEGIQKTDKKAVIDKLKQWRNEELKKSGSPGVACKEFHRVAQGYQSDNEGGYSSRQRRVVAPVSCTGNEPDLESHRNSTQSSSKSNGIPVRRTTVYYQGQIQTKTEESDSGSKTTAARQEQRKTRDIESLQNARDDVIISGNELQTLKEGLRIVDEVRDCLVKKIADIQEQKLYEQLNNISQNDVYNNTKSQELETKSSEKRKKIGKNGLILDLSHIESLSNHFKGLKTILDQVKQSRNDR